MTPLVIFKIAELNSVQIVINSQNKVNIYGYTMDGLHVFDEVEARYIEGNRIIVLAKDIVQHIISSFSIALEKALNNNLQLDTPFALGKLGYCFSETVHMNVEENGKGSDIFTKYWVWSSPNNVQTWLYNKDDKTYLEISETYPWLFSDPAEDEDAIFFDEYAKNYKPIVLVELQKSLIQEWIQQSHDFLEKVETI